MIGYIAGLLTLPILYALVRAYYRWKWEALGHIMYWHNAIFHRRESIAHSLWYWLRFEQGESWADKRL